MKHKTLLPLKDHKKACKFFESEDDYDKQLRKLKSEMLDLQQLIRSQNRKVILIFEGADASGKGGVIKRLTEFLDPRGFHVVAVGAPNVIEAKENYLQRFFKVLPHEGSIAIFDRSWYGRVLVERVEGIASKRDWKRAYKEINAVEAMLGADGVLILKYFLDVSFAEQKRRFDEREGDPLKQWKITDDDRRNRAKWDQYHAAYVDMIRNTSTEIAPWELVAADSKWYARVSILTDVVRRGLRRFDKKKV